LTVPEFCLKIQRPWKLLEKSLNYLQLLKIAHDNSSLVHGGVSLSAVYQSSVTYPSILHCLLSFRPTNCTTECHGGNVTSAGWQVTLCDPIWHVSFRNGGACCELLYGVTLLYFTTHSSPLNRCAA